MAGIFVVSLIGEGLLVLRRHQNVSRLLEFRSDSACMAPLAADHPVHSERCDDENAVVLRRWSAGSRSGHEYYLALRLTDGTVDTARLFRDSDTWDKAQPGTTLFVRRFARRGWRPTRVVALTGNGTVAETSASPARRDWYLRLIMMRGLIPLLGSIAMLAFLLVVERVPKIAEA